MPGTTATKSRDAIDKEIEHFRQLVIASTEDESVGPEATTIVARLNKLYEKDREAFTPEDVRFVNVLRGYLGARLAALASKAKYAKKLKRKGDKLDHCWRCHTSIDERFTEMCPTCSEKTYQWRICPVCQACGCQRAGTVLI